jgi:ABC-type uncharacterized transport system permease subunit
MVFLTGALIPLSRLPGWMEDIGRFTPISQGVIGLRVVLIDGHTSFPLAGDGGLVWMAGISAAYLAIGIAAFGLGEAHARRRASLGRY